MNTKSVYERPSLAKVGSIEEVTQAASSGGQLDASFPVTTPFADLTFS